MSEVSRSGGAEGAEQHEQPKQFRLVEVGYILDVSQEEPGGITDEDSKKKPEQVIWTGEASSADQIDLGGMELPGASEPGSRIGSEEYSYRLEVNDGGEWKYEKYVESTSEYPGETDEVE